MLKREIAKRRLIHEANNSWKRWFLKKNTWLYRDGDLLCNVIAVILSGKVFAGEGRITPPEVYAYDFIFMDELSSQVQRLWKEDLIRSMDTNFVDIVFQKQRLRISINMKFSEINDLNGICKDITGIGRWGNGDVELFMEHQDELDQIMEIVKQSFDAQAE